jgi:hypothetical protein
VSLFSASSVKPGGTDGEFARLPSNIVTRIRSPLKLVVTPFAVSIELPLEVVTLCLSIGALVSAPAYAVNTAIS